MPYRIVYHRSDMPRIEAASKQAQARLGTTGSKDYTEVKRAFEEIAREKGLALTEERPDADLSRISLGLDARPQNSDVVATVNTSAVHIIYYTPFPCMYAQCEGLFQAKAGYAVERHLKGAKPLAKYGAHAIFYVVCHGDKTAGMVSCDCGKCGNDTWDGNGLIAYELWERVREDGLPANATAIRLWICLGGDAPVGNPNGISFAAAFTRMVEGDDDYVSERTSIQSYRGFLTMTRDGGYSYTERNNDATRVRAAERLVNTKEGSVARQLREKKQA